MAMVLAKIGMCILLYVVFVTAVATGVSIGLKNYFEKGRK